MYNVPCLFYAATLKVRSSSNLIMGDTFSPMKKNEEEVACHTPMDKQTVNNNQNKVPALGNQELRNNNQNPLEEQNGTCIVGKVSTKTHRFHASPKKSIAKKMGKKVMKILPAKKLRSVKGKKMSKSRKIASRKVKLPSNIEKLTSIKRKPSSKKIVPKKMKSIRKGKTVAKKVKAGIKARTTKSKHQKKVSTKKHQAGLTLTSTQKRQKQARLQRQNKARNISAIRKGVLVPSNSIDASLEIVPNSLQSVNLKTYMRKVSRRKYKVSYIVSLSNCLLLCLLI